MGAGGGLGECVEKRGRFPGWSAFRRRPGREGERCTLGQMLCGVGGGVPGALALVPHPHSGRAERVSTYRKFDRFLHPKHKS